MTGRPMLMRIVTSSRGFTSFLAGRLSSFELACSVCSSGQQVTSTTAITSRKKNHGYQRNQYQ
jgi:hypothetical protein